MYLLVTMNKMMSNVILYIMNNRLCNYELCVYYEMIYDTSNYFYILTYDHMNYLTNDMHLSLTMTIYE